MIIYISLCVFCVQFDLAFGFFKTYAGCFYDDPNNRVLPHIRLDSYTLMTNNRCAQRCCSFLEGATYSGVENGRECFCGDMQNIPASKGANENQCSTACPGNILEMCGAYKIISIWKLNCSEIHNTECQDSYTTEPTTVVVPNVGLDPKITDITEKIRVDKRQTGAYKRTKVSAYMYDGRKSVQYIGVGGIVVIVLPIITVMLSDIMNLLKCKNKNKTDKNGSVNE